MTRYEQEYYADIKNQTGLLERIAVALEELVKNKTYEKLEPDFYKNDKNQPGQAGNGFDVDIRNATNKTLDEDKSISVITANEDLLMGSFPIPKSPTETIIKRFKDGEFKTKKQAILAYVDTFGSDGARYVDVIKFAYDLNYGVGKFQPTTNRGYYACAFGLKGGGHLIKPGRDGNYLVKPFNYTYYSNEYVSDVGVDVIENYLLEKMIELNELEASKNKTK